MKKDTRRVHKRRSKNIKNKPKNKSAKFIIIFILRENQIILIHFSIALQRYQEGLQLYDSILSRYISPKTFVLSDTSHGTTSLIA